MIDLGRNKWFDICYFVFFFVCFQLLTENCHFTFGSPLGNCTILRSFTAGANGNSMDENENENESVNSDSDLKKKAKEWLEERKMNHHWESVALWWDTNVGYAKNEERERMENNLKEECGMTQSKAEATAQWFMDNFKSTQEAPKGMFEFCFVYFCVMYLVCHLFLFFLFCVIFSTICDFLYFLLLAKMGRICVLISGWWFLRCYCCIWWFVVSCIFGYGVFFFYCFVVFDCFVQG